MPRCVYFAIVNGWSLSKRARETEQQGASLALQCKNTVIRVITYTRVYHSMYRYKKEQIVVCNKTYQGQLATGGRRIKEKIFQRSDSDSSTSSEIRIHRRFDNVCVVKVIVNTVSCRVLIVYIFEEKMDVAVT